MTSTRPYLIRAIYEWIVDNGHTPHLLVEVRDESVQVPRHCVENGAIVLNVSPNAVRGLDLGNDFIRFSARFSGNPHDIIVPVDAVQAIYARENGQGIFLSEQGVDTDRAAADGDAGASTSAASAETEGEPATKRAPHLKIVK